MNRAAAISIIRHTEAHGGGTFYAGGLDAKLTNGYIVGGIVPSLTIAWGQEDKTLASAIVNFARQHKARIAGNPFIYIGTWVDDAGTLHVDLSEVVHNQVAAIGLGIARNEIAIWDVARAEEISLRQYRQAIKDIIAPTEAYG